MKCKYCSKEFPKNIWKIHAPLCKNEHEDKDYHNMSYNELRRVAKEKNIDLGSTPKKEELLKALENKE